MYELKSVYRKLVRAECVRYAIALFTINTVTSLSFLLFSLFSPVFTFLPEGLNTKGSAFKLILTQKGEKSNNTKNWETPNSLGLVYLSPNSIAND